MKLLRRFYKAEEQHNRKMMDVYSSFQKELGNVKQTMDKEKEESKKYCPKRQFGNRSPFITSSSS